MFTKKYINSIAIMDAIGHAHHVMCFLTIDKTFAWHHFFEYIDNRCSLSNRLLSTSWSTRLTLDELTSNLLSVDGFTQCVRVTYTGDRIKIILVNVWWRYALAAYCNNERSLNISSTAVQYTNLQDHRLRSENSFRFPRCSKTFSKIEFRSGKIRIIH